MTPKGAIFSCASSQACMGEIEQKTCVLIEHAIVGDAFGIEATLAQIAPTKKHELELMAQVIVSKALDEPQLCKACVSLSGALQLLLPPLPSGQQGKKGETFKHALLDVFQTEFEAVCIVPAEQIVSNEEQTQREREAILAAQRNQHQFRIHSIGHLAGHLYCHGLLGQGVVKQMVQDLEEMGQAEVADKLLWFIGIATNGAEQHQHLGTVLEDTGDSDGASSESTSRRPSKT